MELEIQKLLDMRNEIGLTYVSKLETKTINMIKSSDLVRWHKVTWHNYQIVDKDIQEMKITMGKKHACFDGQVSAQPHCKNM